jgi:hypothetical protein
MTALEQATAEALKEVRKDGNSRKQTYKGDTICGSEL